MENTERKNVSQKVSVLSVFKTMFMVKLWETGAKNLPYFVQLVHGDERIDCGYVQDPTLLPESIEKLAIVYFDEKGECGEIILSSQTIAVINIENDVELDQNSSRFCTRREDWLDEKPGERILFCKPPRFDLGYFAMGKNFRLEPTGCFLTKDEFFRYEELKSVTHGDVLLQSGTVEKPFTYDNEGFLKSGKYYFSRRIGKREVLLPSRETAFPPRRPERSEWNSLYRDIHFAIEIRKENWSLFIRAIVGKYFGEINSNERVKALVCRRRLLERSSERIQKAGACFDASTFDLNTDIEVGIGERLLFKGYKNGKMIFAVDSPNYGNGLYFFHKEEPAREWANGEIDFHEARKKAARFIVHSKNWEDRAKLAIN